MRLLLVNQSCSLVGAGIGAIVGVNQHPRFQSLEEREPLPEGAQVRIFSRNGGSAVGTYVGFAPALNENSGPYLVLDSKSGRERVLQSEVLRVDVQLGNRSWVYGGLIGLSLDLMAVAAFGYAVNHGGLGGSSCSSSERSVNNGRGERSSSCGYAGAGY
jgi:hypothetical protein